MPTPQQRQEIIEHLITAETFKHIQYQQMDDINYRFEVHKVEEIIVITTQAVKAVTLLVIKNWQLDLNFML